MSDTEHSHFGRKLTAGRERDYDYVVLFNDPHLDGGWGYTSLTVHDNHHDAVGQMATLDRKHPDVDYKVEVWG